MALPPTLKAFRDRLDSIGFEKRTSYQDSLLKELQKLDSLILQKSIEESTFADTRMTSPGGGGCPCCGR
jgi:hypothetical protein